MSVNVQPEKPKSNQESVWDYPRPPRVEKTSRRIRVIFNSETIADSTNTLRVLETSHPPVYYIPQADIQMPYLSPTPRTTFCEFKGAAHYWTVTVGEQTSSDAAWSYPNPNQGYESLRGYIAFYASKMEACYVNDERAAPQEGDFYGGWITSDLAGPFKGAPGTWTW